MHSVHIKDNPLSFLFLFFKLTKILFDTLYTYKPKHHDYTVIFFSYKIQMDDCPMTILKNQREKLRVEKQLQS